MHLIGTLGLSSVLTWLLLMFIMISCPSVILPKTGCWEGVLLSKKSRKLFFLGGEGGGGRREEKEDCIIKKYILFLVVPVRYDIGVCVGVSVG